MDNMTAKVSCFARAYHHKNKQVPVFDDTAAELLLGEEYEQIARNMMGGIPFFLPGFQGTPQEGLRLIVDKQLSPSVLGRSAYCEKMLANEIRLGCKQYVLFAAGYDTFSLRNTDTTLSVFELDLPEVIEDKTSRIQRAGAESKSVYVSCNLEEITWKKALLDKGFQTEEKTFGSLLGISYYLTTEAFEKLLCAIYDIIPKGSVLCFDYPTKQESKETKVNQKLAKGAGEEMKALYTYEEMEKLLEKCGFLILEHLNHKEMSEQYFSAYCNVNPDEQMEAPEGVAYILAVKK